jgi:glutaredoxin-dependent peroxiredoxin
MVHVNQPAPEFALYNTDKKLVRLSEWKGKNVVLLFIPFAFTGTCTKELCAVRDDISYYDNLNAVVFGISVDTPYSLAKFKEEQKLNMDLLSDFNKEAMQTYDTMYEVFGAMQFRGVAKRSAFVIDKNGILRYAEVLENAGEIPDFGKIKACLESLDQ